MNLLEQFQTIRESAEHGLASALHFEAEGAELVRSFRPNERLILLGGEFRPLSRTLVGPLTTPIGEALHIGKAFFGTIGFTAAGVSTTDPGEAFTKKLILGRAGMSALLADSGKFGRASLVNAGTLDDFRFVVTDSGIPPEFMKILKKHNIEIIQA